MQTKKTRKSPSRPKKKDSTPEPSFLRAHRALLPYDIVEDPPIELSYDRSDPNEFSEWCDALLLSSDERGAWLLAEQVIHHGYKITVKVSAGNAPRVAAMIASRLTEPVLAAYSPKTEQLVFYSPTDRDELVEERAREHRGEIDNRCRNCGARA